MFQKDPFPLYYSDIANRFVNAQTQEFVRQILRENLKDIPEVTVKMKQSIEAQLMAMLTASTKEAEENMKAKVAAAFEAFFDSITTLVSQIKTFEKENAVQDTTEAAAHQEFITIMKRIEVHVAITGHKWIIGAHRACEQTLVFQLLRMLATSGSCSYIGM